MLRFSGLVCDGWWWFVVVKHYWDLGIWDAPTQETIGSLQTRAVVGFFCVELYILVFSQGFLAMGCCLGLCFLFWEALVLVLVKYSLLYLVSLFCSSLGSLRWGQIILAIGLVRDDWPTPWARSSFISRSKHHSVLASFFVSNYLLESESALAQVGYTHLWWFCMYTYMVDCDIPLSC
jgi:hypothetical protein